MNNREKLKKAVSLLLCLVLSLSALVSCQSEVGESPPAESREAITFQLVKLKRDVNKGEKLTKEHIELAQAENTDSADELFSSIDEVVGKYASTDLCAGDFLYKVQVSDKVSASVANETLRQTISKCPESFVVVTDYIQPNTGRDLHTNLQGLINKNPGRTLYFPDGEYIISSSLVTKSAGPQSTTFFFSDNAVLKASDSWPTENGRQPLITIGQKQGDGEHLNDNTSIGSYFGVFGGILDGNGKADGIDIVSSRESVIYGTCIKNTIVGIEIKEGANGGSSDSDIENVEIIGNGATGSRGIVITGYDNTVSNVKIYNMEVGIYSNSGGNACRSVSVYFSEDYKGYNGTVGILHNSGANFLYDCYVENACKAYIFKDSTAPTIDGIAARWTYEAQRQIAFDFPSVFNCHITQARVDFCGKGAFNTFITAKEGTGKLESPILDTTLESGGQYKKFVSTSGVIDLSKMN